MAGKIAKRLEFSNLVVNLRFQDFGFSATTRAAVTLAGTLLELPGKLAVILPFQDLGFSGINDPSSPQSLHFTHHLVQFECQFISACS